MRNYAFHTSPYPLLSRALCQSDEILIASRCHVQAFWLFHVASPAHRRHLNEHSARCLMTRMVPRATGGEA
eukprot:2081178-Rhodomonas_salina.5